MFRQVVPRFCRQFRAIQVPSRGLRRDLPIRFPWFRGRTPWDDFFRDSRNPFRMFDEHMRDMFSQMERMMGPYYYGVSRPRFAAENGTRSEVSEVKYDGKLYEVKVDVHQFEPENLNVKITDDKLIITGKHESKADEHGFVSREFSREFLLPEDVDIESISSKLTEDGYLMIRGKVKGAEEASERVINIERENLSSQKPTEQTETTKGEKS